MDSSECLRVIYILKVLWIMKLLISSPSPECAWWSQGKWPSSHLSILSIFKKIFSPRDIWKVTEVIWKFETWTELFCKKSERGQGWVSLCDRHPPSQQKVRPSLLSCIRSGVKHDPCWPECVHIMCHSDCVWQMARPSHNNTGQSRACRAWRGPPGRST